MEEIRLSAPGKNHLQRAVLVHSILTCVGESEAAVYVKASIGTTITLNPGDSMHVPANSDLSVWVFCKSSSKTFHADLTLEAVKQDVA